LHALGELRLSLSAEDSSKDGGISKHEIKILYPANRKVEATPLALIQIFGARGHANKYPTDCCDRRRHPNRRAEMKFPALTSMRKVRTKEIYKDKTVKPSPDPPNPETGQII
jgi:hypothetical protein